MGNPKPDARARQCVSAPTEEIKSTLARVHASRELSHYARCAAQAIAWLDEPTIEDMAQFWSCSGRSIQRGLRELEEAGVIETTERTGYASTYTFKRERSMSDGTTMIPHSIVFNEELSTPARVVYMIFLTFVEGGEHVDEDVICSCCKESKEEVLAAIDELKEKGYVKFGMTPDGPMWLLDEQGGLA